MQPSSTLRSSVVGRQEGIALIVTLMVMMLVSVLMVGFVTAIMADQRASGLDRDQTHVRLLTELDAARRADGNAALADWLLLRGSWQQHGGKRVPDYVRPGCQR